MKRPNRPLDSAASEPISGTGPARVAPETPSEPTHSARNRRLGVLLPLLVFGIPLVLVLLVELTGATDRIARVFSSLW